jgi:hypothetical protein
MTLDWISRCALILLTVVSVSAAEGNSEGNSKTSPPIPGIDFMKPGPSPVPNPSPAAFESRKPSSKRAPKVSPPSPPSSLPEAGLGASGGNTSGVNGLGKVKFGF